MEQKDLKFAKAFQVFMKIAAVFAIVYMSFSAYIYTVIKQDILDTFNVSWENNVNQTESALEDWIYSQIKFANFIAKDSKVIDACLNPNYKYAMKNVDEYMLEIQNEFKYFENIGISIARNIDYEVYLKGEKIQIEGGKVIVISDSVAMIKEISEQSVVGKDVTNIVGISDIIQGKEYFISQVYPSFSTGNPVFTVSIPVKSDNKIIGVMSIAIQIDYFSEKYIDKFKYQETGRLFFLDGIGQIIAHENRDYILNDSPEFKIMIKSVLDKVFKGETKFHANFSGELKHYVASKADISEENIKYPWYIVFTQEDIEIFSGVDRLLKIISGIGVVAGIVLIFLIYKSIEEHNKNLEKDNLKKMNEVLEIKVKERTEKLEQMAVTDSLTGLFNHKYFIGILKNEVRDVNFEKENLVVLMFDLDYFKKINDNYGHLFGDEVLVKFSENLKEIFEDIGVVARYGGEEFIGLIKNKTLEESLIIAEKFRNQVETMKFSEELSVTVSIGCVKLEHKRCIEIIKEADNLLYLAKKNGRNRVEY